MDWWAAGLAGALCLAMALAEGVLSGSDLQRWLASLTHPRFYAPLWVWVSAAKPIKAPLPSSDSGKPQPPTRY
jgi:hypothetical protein